MQRKKRGEGQIDCLQIATIGARICIYMYIYIYIYELTIIPYVVPKGSAQPKVRQTDFYLKLWTNQANDATTSDKFS